MKYFLSLGSNLGDRKKNISRALAFLSDEGVKTLHLSSLYKTQPVGYSDQPWFYNQVVEVGTRLNPYDLLGVIKRIELKLKRQPAVPDGPRTLDIDILLAEKSIIQTKKLIIPHPRLDKRNFILTPLKELSPDTFHPVLRQKIRDLLKKSGDPSLVIKLKKRKKRAPAGRA